jgi:hypothetical protein
MTDLESVIFIVLMLRPGHAYITPDGYKLYVLVGDQMVRIDSARSFWAMTDAEVNKYIQNHFSQ